MLFADSNIEISTNQVINLNAGRYIHFNILEEAPTSLNLTSVSPKILLGTKFDLTPPTEPLLLGKQTSDFLLDFLKALDAYALSLISAANDPEGSPSSKMRASGDSLQTQLKPLYDRIQKLLSKHTFTI
jgi:hypothetical protein